MDRKKNFIWIDLEMTGLQPEKHVILEVASIITDSQLNVLATGPELILHQPAAELEKMDSWVRETHTKSGLIESVRLSTITEADSEEQLFDFFKQYCDENTALLAGNSVWQDRNFLYKYMPSLVDYCYYRVLDVTAIKEVVARWYPEEPHSEFKKKDAHRALDDIKESIEELKHLRKYFFKK